jgi:hypothetical protein
MAENNKLHAAKRAKNDEFYTQWADIEKEVMAYVDYDKDAFRGKTVLLPCDDPEWSNFTKFFALRFDTLGLKKLISTSYTKDGSPGKVFTLERDVTGDGRTNFEDMTWKYLEGDGDFRSDEVRVLRDAADMVITNPPFSLFREFLAWIIEGDKKFLIIGNMNAITYKEVFPLIKNNQIWLGNGFSAGNAYFASPFAKDYPEGVYQPDTGLVKFRNVCWFSNIDHGRRHESLDLVTMEKNLRYNRVFEGKTVYDRYDNYDAINVPKTLVIPSDYAGVMGVPISFLDKYCPEQFEIVGSFNAGSHGAEVGAVKTETVVKGETIMWNGPVVGKKPLYKRILIKHKNLA